MRPGWLNGACPWDGLCCSLAEGMPLSSLDPDQDFNDFNFSFLWDPALQKGLTELQLLKLVHEGRAGRSSALAEFADAMYFTLRPQAFDAYQHFHGPVGFGYSEWFHAKLSRFLQILLYQSVHVTGTVNNKFVYKTTDWPVEEGFTIISFDGETVQPDELEEAIGPGHNVCREWLDLAQKITEHPKDRLKAAQEWLTSHRPENPSTSSQTGGWTKNRERDEILRNSHGRGMERGEICRELDRRTIPTLSSLQDKGFGRWADAWKNPEARKSIQTLFSKVLLRQKPVNPRAISE
jgi:hypothetical protein